MSQLSEIRDAMREFADARGWARFHDPKSLVLALTGEVGELAELLQWLPAEEVAAMVREPALSQRVGEELADVLLYLVLLADVCEVDLAQAALEKITAAQTRYPARDVQGVAPRPRGLT